MSFGDFLRVIVRFCWLEFGYYIKRHLLLIKFPFEWRNDNSRESRWVVHVGAICGP